MATASTSQLTVPTPIHIRSNSSASIISAASSTAPAAAPANVPPGSPPTASSICEKISQFNAKIDPIITKYFGCSWPGFITTIIWTLLLILLTVQTVRGIIPLFDEYRYNNTIVQMDVRPPSEAHLPNLTICIPYYSIALNKMERFFSVGQLINFAKSNRSLQDGDCYECDLLKDRNWDVWNYPEYAENENILFPFLKEKSLLNQVEGLLDRKSWEEIDVFLRKFDKNALFNKSKTMDVLESFDGTNNLLANIMLEKLVAQNDYDSLLENRTQNWNQPLFDAVWRFFSCWYTREMNLMPYLSFPYSYCLNLLLDYTKLENAFKNSKMNQLFDLAIRSVEAYFTSKSWHNSLLSKFTLDPLQNKVNLVINEDFCFYLFSYSDDRQSFSYQFPPYFGKDNESSLDYFGNIRLIDFSSDQVISKVETEVLGLKYRFKNVINFYTIDSNIVDWRSNRNCSSENDSNECIWKLLVEYVAKNCNCIPFSTRFFRPENLTNLQYCTPKIYETCAAQNASLVFQRQCFEKCEYNTYFWFQTDVEINSGSGDPSGLLFDVNAVPDKPFKRFSMVDKNSLEQFLALLGGIVNLYLGFSGITVCAILTVSYDLVKRLYRLKANSALANATAHGNGTDNDIDRRKLDLLNIGMEELKQAVNKSTSDFDALQSHLQDVKLSLQQIYKNSVTTRF